RQIELLKTFADQAVIAVENVQLFNELQDRTAALTRSVGQLTALGEVGQAVSSSLELSTVLTTIVARAVQLCAAAGGAIYEDDGEAEEVYLRAHRGPPPPYLGDARPAPGAQGRGADRPAGHPARAHRDPRHRSARCLREPDQGHADPHRASRAPGCSAAPGGPRVGQPRRIPHDGGELRARGGKPAPDLR